MKEGKTSVLSGVPVSLPALVKAMRLQEKSKQVGFEWENAGQVWEKVEEELGEFKIEMDTMQADTQDEGVKSKVEGEFGDLLFSLVNFARFLKIDPESALERTNKKFIQRFQLMEQEAQGQGKKLTDMSLSEMDEIWNRIKHLSRK